MGTLCSCYKSIQKIQIEIGEPRNEVARLVRDREVSEVEAEGVRTTTCSSCGGMSEQAAATRGGRAGHGGRPGGPREPEAVAAARRARNARRNRT